MRRRETFVFATDLNRHRGRTLLRVLLALMPLLLLAGFLLNYIQSHQVVYTSERVAVPNLPNDLENYSILHLSDLHGSELGENQVLFRNSIRNASSSVIVMTGDMLGKDGEIEPLLDLIAVLPEGTPKLYLPGDEDPAYLDTYAHSSLSPLSDWAEQLVASGVTILDEPVLFTRGRNGSARIWFIPEEIYTLNLENMETSYQTQLKALNAKSSLSPDEAAMKRVMEYQTARVSRIRSSIKSMKETDVQVVVSHAPVTESYLSTVSGLRGSSSFSLRNAALILSGHYCGGMWRLPFGGPIFVEDFGWFPPDDGICGWMWLGGIPQYISPGLGASRLVSWQPFRLFNSPAATRLVLSNSRQ